MRTLLNIVLFLLSGLHTPSWGQGPPGACAFNEDLYERTARAKLLFEEAFMFFSNHDFDAFMKKHQEALDLLETPPNPPEQNLPVPSFD